MSAKRIFSSSKNINNSLQLNINISEIRSFKRQNVKEIKLVNKFSCKRIRQSYKIHEVENETDELSKERFHKNFHNSSYYVTYILLS